MPRIADWKLANPEAALQAFRNEPLGSASIDHKPIGLTLAPNLAFDGDDDGRLTLNLRGALSVAVLNDAADPDEDGILNAASAPDVEGLLPPQLMFNSGKAWVKYRAQAGLKASGGVPVTQFIGLQSGAEATAIFADYRVHRREAGAREVLVGDLLDARFVTKVTDVLKLAEGEALAFRFAGALSVAVTVRWSDIFAGPVGSLGALLGSTLPIVISTRAGATLTLNVRVTDEFLVVFSRADERTWRTGIRKVRSSQAAPSLDAGIDVGFADPSQLQELVTATLEGLFGASLDRVEAVLAAASLDALGAMERRVASLLLDRLELRDELATIENLRARVVEIRTQVRDTLDSIVRTRIGSGFAYEYNRTAVDSSLIQATLDRDALAAFHEDLIRARTERLADALRDGRPGMQLELYLHQKEITRTRSYGFSLGFGKWASVGGKDFRKMSSVRRTDIHGRVQESYLGARTYTGQWTGEKTEWSVDLKADMKDYVSEPLVNDYSFGIHLLWTEEQADLSGAELEAWLDGAVVWRILRESDMVDVRASVAGALRERASCAVQLTIPNTVIRSVLPLLAEAPVASYAPVLAASMPWMPLSPARTAASLRRRLYAPLWAAYLEDPDRPQDVFARIAAEHVKAQGHPELALRELVGTRGPDPFSFAGLVHINGNTRAACQGFTRGLRILHTAILSGARNQRTIDRAISEMDVLWRQSHHVRTIGAYLLEAADRAGVLDAVSRTLTVTGPALEQTVVVTA